MENSVLSVNVIEGEDLRVLDSDSNTFIFSLFQIPTLNPMSS